LLYLNLREGASEESSLLQNRDVMTERKAPALRDDDEMKTRGAGVPRSGACVE
jgi:hypothetical protein